MGGGSSALRGSDGSDGFDGSDGSEAWTQSALCRGVRHNVSSDWFDQYDVHAFYKGKPFAERNFYATSSAAGASWPPLLPLVGYNQVMAAARVASWLKISTRTSKFTRSNVIWPLSAPLWHR